MILKKETRRWSVRKALKKLNRVLGTCLLGISLGAIVSASALAADDDGRTSIYSGCTYDSLEKLYYYSVDGVSNAAISSTILNGTYTDDSVLIYSAGGVNYSAYRNGKEYATEGRFYEPGEYAITVYDNKGRKEVPLKFTILGDVTNDKRYDFPSTCRVYSVELDGEEIHSEKSYVSLEAEGEYKISYEVLGNEEIETFHVTIDTTAPTLKIKGLNAKNEADGPVELTKNEKASIVTILRNGVKMDFDEKLVDSGDYKVTVQDEAGNQTVYEFVIIPYYNFSSFVVFGFGAILVVGIVAYIVFLRKNLRVR